MQSEMTYDDAQNKAIESGLLSIAEIESLKNTLVEMRRLANKDRLSSKESIELSQLIEKFNDLVKKGAPELEHYKPDVAGGLSLLFPSAIALAILAAVIFLTYTNA